MSCRSRKALPRLAAAYLSSLSGYEVREAPRIVHALHSWLDSRQLSLRRLHREDLEAFLEQPLGNNICPTTRAVYLFYVRRYIGWLHERQACAVDSRTLCRRLAPPRRTWHGLPAEAEEFLAQLVPTTRRSTQLNHRHRLQWLHGWLGEQGLSVQNVTRHVIEQWTQHLHAQRLAVATRLGILVTVRGYLEYLADQGSLPLSPKPLIRRSDMPNLPKYLPRPLPPDVDQEIQRRLKNSSSPLQWGLLLMRNTGLRIGELRALPCDCLRTDERGRHFLKVPLGKLNSERLVPVDDDTLRLVRRLRDVRVDGRAWLLQTRPGRPTSATTLQCELASACSGIKTSEPITSHRLRHSYATTLLNAGMSLTGVMRLLGHQDVRMTLRYAAVTLEGVREEYFKALEKIEQRYRCTIRSPADSYSLDPTQALADLIRFFKAQVPTLDATAARHARLTLRRLERLRNDVASLALSIEVGNQAPI